MSRHVVVTGASSGIGAACARAFHANGDRLSLGARRVERLAEVVPDAFCHQLDVTDAGSVERFVAAAVAANGPIDVLVNNAGLARDVEKIAEGTGEAWREMIETNVLGLLEVTRRVLPQMIARKTGHVVVIGSIAGHKAYVGGGVYCGSKRALQPICEAIRMETLGSNIRVTSVDPGMVDTEFSLVRFRGDAERAAKVYTGTRPLTAEDVAECVAFAANRPAHVNLDTIVVMPTDQANPQMVHRQ
ncbi:MAG: SDR family NAD(P)-dependent oxidoreductase [Planctomycetes bacterium]|nr:SDR family NAD(P)-dependent oxidoreductase [Planctomycetota bacterium]MCB9885530.1 SDR family NAD(P)-dependent oxidoreductase [Planctomycetota bacterium]